MANKYQNAYAVLLNNGEAQILPVSKAQLIELAQSQQNGQFGENAKDVATALTYLLNKTNSDLTAAKTYTGESINALNQSYTAEQGYVLSGITQSAGVLSAYSQTWLDASVVSYSAGEEGATVQSAIEDIQATLAEIAGEGEGSIDARITAAIEGLDHATMSETGKAIVSVEETDGIVTAYAGNIDSSYVDVANTSNLFKLDGDSPAVTISTQAALEQLQAEINAVEGAAAKYTISAYSGELPANVGARYQLMESINGGAATAVATNIDIPADSSLVEVYLGASADTVNSTTGVVTKNSVDDAQSMNFIHKLADGTYSITKIDISKFFTESERGDGIVKTGSTLAVQVDSASEGFLTVGENGVKVSGVQDAIYSAVNTYVNGLDSEIAAKTDDSIAYALTGVVEADGKLSSASYIALIDSNIQTTFASDDAIKTLAGANTDVSDVKKALNEIAGKINTLGGDSVTDIAVVNGTYVSATAAKSGNTYTLTIDDSALGNVSTLQYDELTVSDLGVVTLYGANPEL